MTTFARAALVTLASMLLVTSCGGDDVASFGPDPTPVGVAVNELGLPLDWPIELPPGRVIDCPNGDVIQEDLTFSIVACLDEESDPFAVSQNYLTMLEDIGLAESEPGAFTTTQQTFLEGNGIEIYFQLVDAEIAIVLVKTA